MHSIVPMVPISVVIPTYNRPNILVSTVQSYLAGDVLPTEIVIVDQSETAIDHKSIGDARGVNVRIVNSDVPSSTRSRNIGVRESTNDIVLFSDDDVLVASNTIEQLWLDMQETDIALIASINKTENSLYGEATSTGVARSVGGILMGMKKPWRKGGYVVRSNMRGRFASHMTVPQPTEWAMGFFFCVRKSLMERWDCWFDESLKRYAYAEDLDFSMRYCSRASSEDMRTIVDPRLWVQHLASTEWRTPSDEATHYYVQNRRYISKKIYPCRWWYRLSMSWFDTLWALANIRDTAYCVCLLKEVWLGRGL